MDILNRWYRWVNRLFIFFKLRESPRWLISIGRFNEAERVIEEIESSTDKRIEAKISAP